MAPASLRGIAWRRVAATLLLAGFWLALAAACATWGPSSPPPTSAQPAIAPLRVMSFNVRLPMESDGADRWQIRRGLAARMLRDAAPDVIGTQELFKLQGDYFVAQLPAYAWFGRDRRGGHGDEHMGVFYRKDRLRVLKSGDFWLSDTPAVPASISWGHPLPRMVTWALFQRIADGRRFYLFNTHLPYREEDEDARVRGTRLLMQRIAALPANVPVVVTGDFNASAPDSPTYAEATKDLRDAWEVAAKRDGPAATFHGFSGKADGRIDWILVRGFDVAAMRTLDVAEDGRYPSDHFPLLAELTWPASSR
jgi:endonuclease/exonuclease/phosphatase family metal-dependent hydrolase